MKRLICTFIALTIGGCASSLLGGEGDHESTKQVVRKVTVSNLTLFVSLAERVVVGTAANIQLEIKNHGKVDVVFIHRSKYYDFDLVLRDQNGKPRPFTQFGKNCYGAARTEATAVAIKSLRAGETLKTTLNIGRVFDLTNEGQYELEINWRSIDAKDQKSIKLTIDKLSFKVVDDGRF